MLLGIALKIISVLLFSGMNALGRAESALVPTGEIVFFRSWPALIVLMLWLAWQGQWPQGMLTARPFGHLLRGLLGAGGMFSGFAALSFLPLADVVAIGFAAPLFGVVLAALILKERVRIYRWSAVIIGFCGVLIMLREHLGEAAGGAGGSLLSGLMAGGTMAGGNARVTGSALALCGAFCAACAMTQTRRLTQTEKTGAIVFYFSLLTTLLGFCSFFVPMLVPRLSGLLGPWLWPAPWDIARLVAMGVLGGCAQIFMTESYRMADASLVAGFDYLSMIFAVCIGYLAFGDVPSFSIVAGAAIVMGAGGFVLWREHRLGLFRAGEGER